MNSKLASIYILALCYSVFSFAMAVPSEKMSVYDWIVSIVLNGILYVFLSLIIFTDRKPQPIADLILLIYILLLIAKQLNYLNNYMKIYHRQTSTFGNIVITVVLLFIFSSMGYTKTAGLASPSAALTIILIVMLIFLNIGKINPANLNAKYSLNTITYFNVTLFDYIIPMSLALYGGGKDTKKKAVFTVIIQMFVLIILTVVAFSCIKGDLLYSISPLQILFQVSSGNLIKNFDAIFNLLLYFSYFSSILLLVCAYSKIKQRFRYFSNADLFLILIFVMFAGIISDFAWFIIQLASAAVILAGSRKEKVK